MDIKRSGSQPSAKRPTTHFTLRQALSRRDFLANTAFSKITVHGGRMNEMQMQVVDQSV